VRSAPCIRRRGTHVSWFGLKIKVDGFFRFGLKTGGYVFLSLCLKTGIYNCDLTLKLVTPHVTANLITVINGLVMIYMS
jgi:hypothetical protein